MPAVGIVIEYRCSVLCVQSQKFIGVKRTDRFSANDSRTCQIIFQFVFFDGIRLCLVLIRWITGRNSPGKIIDFNWSCRQSDRITDIFQTPVIHHIRSQSIGRSYIYPREDIFSLFVVKISTDIQASVKKAHIQSDIGLLRFFPFQVGVRELIYIGDVLVVIRIYRLLSDQHIRSLAVQHISLHTVRHA